MTEKVWFKNSKGMKLCGLLDLQKNKSPMIILVHGLMPITNKHEKGLFDELVPKLFKEGYSVFRFDFHCHGESEGNYVDVSTYQEMDDLKCAIDFVEKYSENISNIGVMTTSFGFIPTVLLNDKRIKVIQFICPSIHTKIIEKDITSFAKNFGKDWKKEFKEKGYAILKLHPEKVEERQRKIGVNIFNEMIDINTNRKTIEAIKKVKIPVFILAAGSDRSIDINDVKKLFEVANEPKEIFIDEKADHNFFETQRERNILFEQTKKWFKKWLK